MRPMPSNDLVATKDVQLPANLPTKTWDEVMAIADPEELGEFPQGFDVDPSFHNKDGSLTEDGLDALARAEVTPEMTAGLNPIQRQLLARLDIDVRNTKDPLELAALLADRPIQQVARQPSWLTKRAATLIAFIGIPQAVVTTVFGEALMLQTGDRFDWAVWQVKTELFELWRRGTAARPAFYSDEFAAMAQYVASHGLATLTAESDREFFNGDQRVPLRLINSAIQTLLDGCEIVDASRKLPVSVSNRLIAEVRSTLARSRPRMPNAASADNAITNVHSERWSMDAAVAEFATDCLVLEDNAWTASEELYKAWTKWCAERNEQPGEEPRFFKLLVAWSGRRILRNKPQTGLIRTPGYRGIKLAIAE